MVRDGGKVPLGVLSLAMRLKSRRGIQREVRLVISHSAGSPFTFGVFTPYIVLPTRYGDMNPSDLRMVLDHEMAHIQRLDAMHGWILQFFLAVWWFHPLTWVVLRKADAIKERACDDLVLLSGEDSRRYALCLGEAVLRANQQPTIMMAASSFVRRTHHLGRLHAILDPFQPRKHPSSRETVVACAPMMLGAVFLSSLGFKAVSDLQPSAPARFTYGAEIETPSLWSDALEPLIQALALPGRRKQMESHEIVHFDSRHAQRLESQPQLAQAGGILQTLPGSKLITSEPPGPWPHRQIISENHDVLAESYEALKPTVIFPLHARPPIAPTAPIAPIEDGGNSSSGSLPAAPDPIVASLALAGEAEPYTYAEINDLGLIIYSGITSHLPESAFTTRGSISELDDAGEIPVAKYWPETPLTAGSPVTQAGGIIQESSINNQEIPNSIFTLGDLGVWNLRASITQDAEGGQLSVSFEVPEYTAMLWTAEASTDSTTWTESESVLSRELSIGTSPGFLRIEATLSDPMADTEHSQIRLRSKW